MVPLTMMKRIFGPVLAMWLAASPLWAQQTDAEFERELREIVDQEKVTVVHFWATWCPNCWFEHEDDGWRNFVKANPEVDVVFVSIWGSKPNDERELAKYGMNDLPNFQIMRHPNQTRRGDDRVNTLLDLPVTWLPTTWVFREGRMRYAINYGEVRFGMLQQMVNDSRPGQW